MTDFAFRKGKIPLPRPDPRSWQERAVGKVTDEVNQLGAIHPDSISEGKDSMDYEDVTFQKMYHGKREEGI